MNLKKKKIIVLNEFNRAVMKKMIEKYGEKKGKQIYYATANKYNLNPEDFTKND